MVLKTVSVDLVDRGNPGLRWRSVLVLLKNYFYWIRSSALGFKRQRTDLELGFGSEPALEHRLDGKGVRDAGAYPSISGQRQGNTQNRWLVDGVNNDEANLMMTHILTGK